MKHIRTTIHYSLHFLAPGILSWVLFPDLWQAAWALMLATMLVDLDHLLARPMFDPNRCSIGFHPLHSYYAIGFYAALLFVSNVYAQIVAVGLLFHMLTDWQDCLWIKRS
jgi:hypothetical protein